FFAWLMFATSSFIVPPRPPAGSLARCGEPQHERSGARRPGRGGAAVRRRPIGRRRYAWAMSWSLLPGGPGPGARPAGVAVDPAWVHARTAAGKAEGEPRLRVSPPSTCRRGLTRLRGQLGVGRLLFLVCRRIVGRRDTPAERGTLSAPRARVSEDPLIV